MRFNIKDCVGAWVQHTWGPNNGTCTGACEGGEGLLPEVYFVSVAAANGEPSCGGGGCTAGAGTNVTAHKGMAQVVVVLWRGLLAHEASPS